MKSISLLVTVLLPALAVLAGENGSASEDNPLAGLPSKPNAEHLARIKALGDNAWLNLGQARADPKWGLARGRAWGSRMAYAPDLGGAFLCGEGPHRFVKPNKHYMDDLWFYDAATHRWICVYPGAHVKNLKLKLDKNGFEFDDNGDFVPVAYLGHTYNLVTYDTHLSKYVIAPLPGSWWGPAIPHRGEWLGIPPEKRGRVYLNGKLNVDVKNLIFYDVKAGKWERRFVSGKGPKKRFEGVIQYIPGRKQILCLRREGIWFYDCATNEWTGPRKAATNGYDSNACLDTRRERLYVAGRGSFLVYDIKEDKWSPVKGKDQPEKFGCTNNATLHYDTAGDVLIWRSSGTSLRIYDPEKNEWKAGAPAPACKGLVHGFYHEKLNAHFWYKASDGRHKGSVLVYRYKKAGK